MIIAKKKGPILGPITRGSHVQALEKNKKTGDCQITGIDNYSSPPVGIKPSGIGL